MWVKKQQLEPDIKQNKTKQNKTKLTGSKLEKEYVKAVYSHPAYLTFMQSSSWEMPDWMKHKLKSRCWEKYQ